VCLLLQIFNLFVFSSLGTMLSITLDCPFLIDFVFPRSLADKTKVHFREALVTFGDFGYPG
jgi:hypothetical protein